MIARLTGLFAGHDGARAVLDVQGVGYEVHATQRDLQRWVETEGAVVAHVHTNVREDAITLYGFVDDLDRRAFLVLRGVSGVGPKVALAALDALGLAGLAGAVADGDTRALTKIPGVGKKLAARLALELKGKLPAGFEPSAPAPVPRAEPAVPDTFALTLARLGYSRTEIKRARSVIEAEGMVDAPIPQQITRALAALSGS